MLVVSTAGAVWGLGEDQPDRAMARMAAMSLLALVVCVVALLASFRPHRALSAVASPERIVWFYGISQHGYVHRLMVGLEDGKLRSLPLPHYSEATKGLLLLEAAAPEAAQGFTEELRVAFRKDPRSLRRAPPVGHEA